MRHLFFLFSLMVATMMAAIGSSCKDEPDIEPEPELEIPGPNDTVSIAGLIPVTAFYDSIHQCIALELETARVRDGWWDTANVKKVNFINYPFAKDFDFIPEKKYYVKVYAFCGSWCYYESETKTAYYYIELEDMTVSRSFNVLDKNV